MVGAGLDKPGMEPQKPPGLPNEMWPALKKALAYSRVPRFKSPKEFVEALGEIPSSHLMELPQPPKAPTPGRTTAAASANGADPLTSRTSPPTRASALATLWRLPMP